MKALLWVGLVLVVLGIVSLFVPLPHTEDHSMQAGDLKIGVQERTQEKVSPIISGALIVGGAVLAAAGARAKS